ncbi:hypothetical protein AAZX31_20G158400 [Glycine max]
MVTETTKVEVTVLLIQLSKFYLQLYILFVVTETTVEVVVAVSMELQITSESQRNQNTNTGFSSKVPNGKSSTDEEGISLTCLALVYVPHCLVYSGEGGAHPILGIKSHEFCNMYRGPILKRGMPVSNLCGSHFQEANNAEKNPQINHPSFSLRFSCELHILLR